MIVFENPQSSRCRFKVTLERHHMSGLIDVELTDARFKNPYNLQVCVPSKLSVYLYLRFRFIIIYIAEKDPICPKYLMFFYVTTRLLFF